MKERLNNGFDTAAKKRCVFAFYMILSLAVFSGAFTACSAQVSQKPTPATDENMILLSSISEAGIYLYASAQDIEDSDLYKGMTLQSGDTVKQFAWEHVTNENWRPELLLEDLTGDDKEELIVKLVYGTGTGVHAEDVRILDVDTLEEFAIQTVESIMADVRVYIKTETDGSETDENPSKIEDGVMSFAIDKSALNSQERNLFREPAFQDYFRFEVRDNTLFATVLAQVSPTEFAGELLIEYMYQDNMFAMKSVAFNENQN